MTSAASRNREKLVFMKGACFVGWVERSETHQPHAMK
jgi:hypothetical protein